MTDQQRSERAAKLRFLAFYLPQFHPIPENDEWWGEGFTEWRNVTKARPLFRGHYQPHLPTDELGFYDLRDPRVLDAQADMARAYGIDGFVFYHYWFTGKRLLEQPVNDMIARGRPDFPFCLCWANENWTRVWDGGDDHILAEQRYSPDDDLAHIRSLLPVFADERYLKINGRPLLLIYRASLMPEPRRTALLWRQETRRAGFPDLHLCRVEAFREMTAPPRQLGFDAAVEFAPSSRYFGEQLRQSALARAYRRWLRPDSGRRWNSVYSYERMVELATAQPAPPYLRYRGAMPSWDNSPRRTRHATIFTGSTPLLYERWVRSIIDRFEPPTPDENLVFINAWNEWGEGNHLEPDRRWGHGYLEAHRRALG